MKLQFQWMLVPEVFLIFVTAMGLPFLRTFDSGLGMDG